MASVRLDGFMCVATRSVTGQCPWWPDSVTAAAVVLGLPTTR